jgi:hypothetical protein
MTIHLATARTAALRWLIPVATDLLVARAANDNAEPGIRDDVLRDALKHFARHGLGAAEQARHEAERAFFAGDRKAYQHWLAICRTLDRRMAAAVQFRTGRSG